jgi:Arc/MetJ-type ribon-helix-helix transcriptional regulator
MTARLKKASEVEKSEKITINVGLVDLGQIDLLVSEGFFANRTDFIRTAIRRQRALQPTRPRASARHRSHG